MRAAKKTNKHLRNFPSHTLQVKVAYSLTSGAQTTAMTSAKLAHLFIEGIAHEKQVGLVVIDGSNHDNDVLVLLARKLRHLT